MSQVFTRVSSALRCSASRHTLLSRPSALPITQAASLSFQPTRSVLQYRPRASPSEDRRPKAHIPVPQPTKTQEELAKLPYVVRRTPSAQLPLYRKWSAGGTRLVIHIKKIDGDRRKMVEDLVAALEINKDEVRLNPTTQHIELKGDYFEKAKKLAAHGWILNSTERGEESNSSTEHERSRCHIAVY